MLGVDSIRGSFHKESDIAKTRSGLVPKYWVTRSVWILDSGVVNSEACLFLLFHLGVCTLVESDRSYLTHTLSYRHIRLFGDI